VQFWIKHKEGNRIKMKRVLIIDDELMIRSVLKKILEREGFNAITASDGEEGMNLFNKEPADLVITDILMPNKEGTEVIRELKEDYENVPIIAISGGGQISAKTHLDALKLFDIDAVFKKPIEKAEFLTAVKNALKL